MVWRANEEIKKETKPSELTDEQLEIYHDEMHIFWKRIEEGIWFDWTFKDVYFMHKSVVIEMLRRKIHHLYPINRLDNLIFIKDINELVRVVNYIKQKN